MKRLKYVGHYDRQEYTKADFTRHGVSEDAAKAVAWNLGDVKEVHDEVADFIQEIHPGEFVEVDEDGLETGAERSEAADSLDEHNRITLNEKADAESKKANVKASGAEGATPQTGTEATGGTAGRTTSTTGTGRGRAGSTKGGSGKA